MPPRPRTSYDIEKLGRLEEHLKRKPQDMQARRERDKLVFDTYLEAPKPAPAPVKAPSPTELPEVAVYKNLLDVRLDLDSVFVVPPSEQNTEVTKRLVGVRTLLVVDPAAKQGLMVARATKQYVEPISYAQMAKAQSNYTTWDSIKKTYGYNW